jgi:Flp pilus assembly protein TadG
MMCTHIRRSRRRSEGQAIVEFALTLVILMILIISVLEMLGLIYTYTVIANSAKEGVRFAIVHGVDNSSPSGPGSTTAVSNRVKDFAGFAMHDVSNLTIAVSYPDGNNNLASRVQVSVSYPFRPLFGMGWPSVTVFSNAAGRIVF